MRFVWMFATLIACSALSISAAAAPPITALAWTPDGNHLVTGSQAGIELRSKEDLAVVRRLDAELENVHDLEFSPGGDVLLAAGGQPAVEGIVLQLAWPSGEVLARYAEHVDVVYDVAYSPDSSLWASAGADEQTIVWKVGTHQPVRRLAGHSQPVTSVAFVDDEVLVTASADQTLRVWDVTEGTLRRTLAQHTAAVVALATRPKQSPAGLPELASIARDRTVRLWQPTIGRLVRFARLEHAPRSLAWTADGRFLAVGCEDGHLRIIDPQSVKMVFAQPLAEGWIHSIAVGPTGMIVAGGEHAALHRVMWNASQRP